MKILDNNTPEKPTIEYPTQWGFKIIGKNKDKLLKCIQEAMGEKKHDCKLGNSSRTGKFHTYNASCSVESEEERNKIFKYFETHEAVNMVI
ncbi:Proposed lipoate regulatory protein YbeD [hydrothermal vent metagenome]|uniref:Proposed lipoate regulatory protein YbeD n=1 Tax=hydrothermal vent metagenome TaxID=652676 RepID=A0A1W1BU81_9ZZZZ